MMQRKIGVLKKKSDDLTKLTSDLHYSTEKIEELFIKDIEQRKNNHNKAATGLDEKTKRTGQLDMREIDQIFDEMDS